MEIFGTVAGILVVLAYAPQALQTIRTRQTRDLSLATYLMVTVASVCWVLYGIHKESVALWLANGIVGILAFIIVVIKLQNNRLNDLAPQDESEPQT